MQFTDYAALRSSVRYLIDADGSQIAATGLPPARPTEMLDMVIALGEQRTHRHLRASTMVTDLSAAVTSNAADLPADLLELKEVRFSGQPPIEILPLDRLRALEASGSSTGTTRYAAQDGDTLRFWPEASGTLLGSYYARPAALQTATWADATTFARYPDVYLYAALCEAAPVIGRDGTVWEGKFSELLGAAMQDERMRAYAGSPLRMRAR